MFGGLPRASQEKGKQYGEPQTTAALRLGSMFHFGMVPFLGHNATEALAYYQEVSREETAAGAVLLGVINVCFSLADTQIRSVQRAARKAELVGE